MKRDTSQYLQSRIVAGLTLAGLALTASPMIAAQEDSAVLEEVLVTARKKDESMQDVSIAVTAFSGAQIDDLVMRNILEMEGFVPNFVIDSLGGVAPGAASLYIRGVGTQEVERSFDPAVGMVIDGVPLSFVNGSVANTFDFAAIEVLRGPQGTLFGRNTTGGVINITRTRPTGELGFKYEVTAGNDDRIDAKALVNFPLGETLSAKLGYSVQKDGGQRSQKVVGGSAGDADNQQFNATLLWEPNENFDALFTYVRYEDELDGVALQNRSSLNTDNPVNPIPEAPCVLPAAVFGDVCGDNVTDIEDLTQDLFDPIDFEWDSFTLNMSWDLAHGTITSITGYQESDEDVPTDFDATSVNFFHALRFQESEQTTTELRYASNEAFSETVDFVAGIFWVEDEYQLDQKLSIAAFSGPAGAVFQNPRADHEREAWAVFGEVHIDLTDKWMLTLGGRYTEEEKKYTGGNAIGGGAIAGYVPGTEDDFFLFGQPIWIPLGSASGKEDWNEFSPKVGLDYRINDDVLTYFSYSEGFRSGGFNGRNNEPGNIGPFDPEFVESWEIGMKGDFLDNTLRLNLAAFYLDYEDKQEEVIQPDGFGGSFTVVGNASTVESMGVEAELTWVANENFIFNANFGWLDAEYDDYVADLNGDGIETDNSHLELRRVPEFTAGANGNYTMQLGPGMLSLFVGYRYTDEYWVETSNDPRGLLDSRGVWDATASYEWDWDEGRSVRITAFGRDLTDEVDFSSAVIVPGTIAFGGVSGGREYGIQVSGNF